MDLGDWEEEMNKRYVGWDTVERQVKRLINDIKNSEWTPDLIVGIVRGGAIPAVWMSNITSIPAEMAKVSFRDDTIKHPVLSLTMLKRITQSNFKTLIVDDINDSGETLIWIQKKIREYNMQAEKQVKYACLMDNQPSNFKDLDYSAEKINKDIDPEWIVFPWEK
jgi:hypoxanthine phosphoribosyltransferase